MPHVPVPDEPEAQALPPRELVAIDTPPQLPERPRSDDPRCDLFDWPHVEHGSAIDGSAWTMGSFVRPCRDWRYKNNYASGRYNVHRYPMVALGGEPVTVRVRRTEGAWDPMIGIQEEGLGPIVMADDTTSLTPSLVLDFVPLTDGWEVNVTASRDQRFILYVTDLLVAEGDSESPIPTDSEYTIHTEWQCPDATLAHCAIEHPRMWNTFYYFPVEEDYPDGRQTRLYDAECRPITQVTTEFSDTLCIQGSGRLANGTVLNYARGCDCGRPCPTGGTVCYQPLDPVAFPWGMGSQVNPLIPLRSIAVDNGIVPHGAVVYISEFDGLYIEPISGLGGFMHDGCFRADDVGGWIRGNHIDIFAGTWAMYQWLDEMLPTRSEFVMVAGDPQCEYVLEEYDQLTFERDWVHQNAGDLQ